MNRNIFQRNGIYQLRRTVDGTRKTVSLGVTSRGEAEAERDRILASEAEKHLAEGILIADTAWDLFESSLCRRQCAPATLQGYKQQWNRFMSILPGKRLSEVSRVQASAYLARLKDSVGPNTWNKHLNALKYVWGTIQIDSGDTLPDIFRGVQAVPVPVNRHEPFTTDQIRALYAQSEGEMRDIIGVAAHTGLRRADVLNLQHSSYDAVKGLLRLVPVKTARMSHEAVIGVSSLVRGALEARSENRSVYVFPEAQSVYEACPQTWGARFQRFMVKTLQIEPGTGQYGFHSFRHFFRSELTEQGVSERVIDCMMCHSCGSVTGRYVHPSAEVLKRAVEGLPALG